MVMHFRLHAAAWVLTSVLGLAILPHSQSLMLATHTTDLRRSVTDLGRILSEKATITFPFDDRWQALLICGSYPRLSLDYSVVVEVGTEVDVQATVTFAKKHGIPFLAVSGAHGWTDTLNRLPYGIQVNMRKLNTTNLDKGRKMATIGVGALQWEVTRALFAEGKQAGKTFPLHLSAIPWEVESP